MFLQVLAGRVHTLLHSSIMDPPTLRKIFERFRILIIGRANAGKTTILQRACEARENPDIHDSAGKKVRTMIQ
jgi:GTPase SAR1 family protein